MLSASVCHGLQSCLELQCNLWFKAAPSKPIFSESSSTINNPFDDLLPNAIMNNMGHDGDDDEVERNPNGEKGGWSFFKSLSNKTGSNQNTAETEIISNKVYIHPFAEQTSSKLSEKSLEMCTESLGSETGNDVIENMEEISLLSLESRNLLKKIESATKPKDQEKRKSGRTMSFPPPIASISGSHGGVKVKPYREGGRLVLRATNIPSSHSYFHAERSDGRLRLCVLKDSSFDLENEEGFETVEEEEEKEEYDEDEEEGTEGNSEDFGGEMGIEKLHGLSGRCKEGGGGSGEKVVLNWEPFLVAT